MVRFLLALPLVLIANAAAAKDGLTVTGQIRVRGEAIGGQPRAGGPPVDAAIFTRARVAARYTRGPVTIGGEIIDSRAYFQRATSLVADNEVNAIEPVQAWIAYAPNEALAIKAGRFTIDLGSRRLVAENGFRNAVNSFTGARIDWHSGTASVTGFWALPHDRLPDDRAGVRDNRVVLDRERTAVQLFGGFGRATIAGLRGEAYAYRLAERDTPTLATRNRHLWTPGVRLRSADAKAGPSFDIEAAAQLGHARASAGAGDRTDLPVRAVFAHAGAGYGWAGGWRPRLIVAFDYGSGEGRARAITRFDSLYGVRGFDYGPTGLFGPVSRVNLLSTALRGEVTPDKRTDAYLTVRPLWLASATDSFGATGVRDASGRSGRHAGTQIDARLHHWLMPDRLQVAVGAAYVAKGRFLRDAPNAPTRGDTRYGYAEITLSL